MSAGATGSAPIVLHGARLTLRRAGEVDLPALMSVLESPDVVQWWGRPDVEQLGNDVRGGSVDVVLVIEVDSQTAGLIQYHEENEPNYRHAGLDICLAPQWQARGLGAEALRTLARYLFEERGHHRLTIDPAVTNHRAIACYRAVGFKPVGVMRRYERGPDGSWHDGLLMDLLREELR